MNYLELIDNMSNAGVEAVGEEIKKNVERWDVRSTIARKTGIDAAATVVANTVDGYKKSRIDRAYNTAREAGEDHVTASFNIGIVLLGDILGVNNILHCYYGSDILSGRGDNEVDPWPTRFRHGIIGLAQLATVATGITKLAGKVAESMGPWNAPKSVSPQVEQVGGQVKQFLGKEARVITNEAGDTVFVSKDGLRRVRFDISRPNPHLNPHSHVEVKVNGKWVKSGPIYPKDVVPE